jgi:hypothetical protein
MIRLTRIFLLCFLLSLSLPTQAAIRAISWQVNPELDQYDNVRLAVEDASKLLRQACRCEVGRGIMGADVVLALPASLPADWKGRPTPFSFGPKFPYMALPLATFRWVQTRTEGQVKLDLRSTTPHGIANGIYALLQERLGFKFVHARQTIVPDMREWPIAGEMDFAGRPRFDKRGFHLHTMHPLELTEAFHDPHSPEAASRVKQYLDWLARNGQNYIDFSLMEGVDAHMAEWLAHITPLVDYAHQRGILFGIDISLHMVQQKSYQLLRFPPKSFRHAETQVRSRLERLLTAKFDVINLEFAIAEFVGGMEKLKDSMRAVVVEVMAQHPGTKLVGRQHVVKPEAEIGGAHDAGSLNIPEDPSMGLLLHTVMCYALDDPHAPVYELDDFSHLKALLAQENLRREVWFYPESAYWVTFDNSVPMLLLPYLGARLRDIKTVHAMGVPGHLTFSSGWEWGYWLVDWSIARWSWRYEGGGVEEQPWATQYLEEILPGRPNDIAALHDNMSALLVGQNLLRHLCPTSAADELPAAFVREFQPRTPWLLGDLAKKEYRDTLAGLLGIAKRLEDGAANQILGWIAPVMRRDDSRVFAPGVEALQQELIDGITITALRMQHRAALYRAVATAYGQPQQAHRRRLLREGIAAAAEIRAQAQVLVDRREAAYRYPVAELAMPYASHTSYDFGYLYTVHRLHFWEREEKMLLRGKTGPFFRSPYALARIAGLRD